MAEAQGQRTGETPEEAEARRAGGLTDEMADLLNEEQELRKLVKELGRREALSDEEQQELEEARTRLHETEPEYEAAKHRACLARDLYFGKKQREYGMKFGTRRELELTRVHLIGRMEHLQMEIDLVEADLAALGE